MLVDGLLEGAGIGVPLLLYRQVFLKQQDRRRVLDTRVWKAGGLGGDSVRTDIQELCVCGGSCWLGLLSACNGRWTGACLPLSLRASHLIAGHGLPDGAHNFGVGLRLAP